MRKLSSLLFTLALVSAYLPTSLAEMQVGTQHGLDPAAFLDSGGTLIVPENFNGSFDLSGWDVRLHAKNGLIFSKQHATFGQWASLGGTGTGLNNSVFDIEFSGGVLYACGTFRDAGGDLDADFIAKFSGGAWSSLNGTGTGLNQYVLDLEIDAGVVYAGGGFTDAGGDGNADYIAKFTAGAWSSLGGPGMSLNNDVNDIEFNGGVLYAGGAFTNAGSDANADNIAKFTGGAWSSLNGLGSGLNNYVLDLEFNGGVLYAGGEFTDAGGDVDADNIAKFTGGAWSSLNGLGSGLNNYVLDLEFNGGVLYAGGFFENAGGDADADFIAKFSSGTWSSLEPGMTLSDFVWDMEFNAGALYATGAFIGAGGDPAADYIAKFSNGVWSSLGDVGTSFNSHGYEIEFNGSVLYAGGAFTDAGGDVDADSIAQFGLSRESIDTGNVSQRGSSEIAMTGTTTFSLGRAFVSVLASAIPSGETNCTIVISENGDSREYGFALDDVVYDIKIICDSGEVNILFAPITVCIRPKDGVVTNKSLFHNHGGGFAAIAGGVGPSGYVCGSTNLLSLFTLGQFALPDTGFAPGEVTQLSTQPEASQYFEYDGLMLEIPQLNVVMPIWGVPQNQNGWDVSWLGENAGYLYGTAYPTWVGNSVLTAHVWNADNSAGPFFGLAGLQHGDQFYVHSGDQTYVYEVRTNRLVSEKNLSVMKDSAYSLVTLITCESFNENSGEYLYRRAVQAVLISVQ